MLVKDEITFEKTVVPDSEIKTCCFWEFARESKFILSVRERCRQIRDSDIGLVERDKIVGKDFAKIFNSLGRVAILFQEGIYALGGMNIYDDVSPFPQPWQSLAADVRRVLVETAAWTPSMVVEQMPFSLANPARVLVLARDIESTLLERRESKLAGKQLAPMRPGWKYANGHETLAVEIDWGRFSNDQIIAGFRKWIRTHRPENVKAPSGQGNKNSDWRAALNRLGMMRALNAFTLADHRFPKFLKEKDDKACYAARKEAGKTFKRLFPFLAETEEPIHWKTKGGKSRS